jgi:Fe-S cluster assembly iron-binding protein IscA
MVVTELAKNKIEELIKGPKEVMPEHIFFLRITAIEDNGIKYQTYFDYETRLDDTLFRFRQFDLRIDPESLKYLAQAILDFNEENGFVLDQINQ